MIGNIVNCAPDLVNRDYGLVNQDYGLVNREYGLVNRDYGLVNREYGLVNREPDLVNVMKMSMHRNNPNFATFGTPYQNCEIFPRKSLFCVQCGERSFASIIKG